MRKNKIFNVDTTKFKAMQLKDNPEFYSRDTDAFLTFTVPDESFEFDNALLYLINIDDGSVVTEIETEILGQANVEYEITSEIMAHYGRWRGQIVFQKNGEKASSAIFEFVIKRFLTDERPPTLNEIVSLEKLRKDARELIEVLEQMTYDPESLTDVLLAKDGELTLDARIRRDVNNLENKKADKAEVSEQLAQKANSSDVRMKSVLISDTDISDALRQQISGNAPVMETIPDKSISDRKIGFIKSVNLYDITAKSNGYIGADGKIVPDTNWSTSDFMQFSEGDILRSNMPINAYGIYGADGTFISRVTGVQIYELSIPPSTYLIKVQIVDDLSQHMMISKNASLPTAYKPYDAKIEKKLIGNLDKSMFDDFEITIDDLEFIKSINLFNKNKIINGFYISYLNGLVLANSSYGYQFINIKGGQSYIRNFPNQHFVWYDSDGNLITNPNAPQVSSIITAPTDAVLIGISVRTENIDSQMFIEGVNLPSEYVAYSPYIPVTALDPSINLFKDTDLLDGIINLPSKLYGITGLSNNIYFDNIINKVTDYDIDVSANQGIHYDNRFGLTSETPISLPLSVSVNQSGKQLASESSTLEVKYRSATTLDFKVLFIGDSNTDRGYYTQKLLELFDADTYSDIELVGTRGAGLNKHEGRSGWSAAVYTKMAALSGVSNAFWNPAKSDFDFAYYATQSSIDGLTHVAISLGTNDIFPFTSDSELINGVPNILADFDKIINSIKDYDNNLKIVIMLPFPINSTQTAFGASYGAGMTRWRYKRNYHYFVDNLINKYDNRTADKIYVVGTNLMMDTTVDFAGVESETTPAVHPAKAGLDKVGEQIYKFLKVVG